LIQSQLLYLVVDNQSVSVPVCWSDVLRRFSIGSVDSVQVSVVGDQPVKSTGFRYFIFDLTNSLSHCSNISNRCLLSIAIAFNRPMVIHQLEDS
jgi:hypothetical protein